jgi:hypothetical protein
MIGDFRHRRDRAEVVVEELGVKWMHSLAFIGCALVLISKHIVERTHMGHLQLHRINKMDTQSSVIASPITSLASSLPEFRERGELPSLAVIFTS